jgi:type III pantothenate kinase
MLLVIDAGNTNVVFAVFDGDRITGEWRISTDGRRTADEYAVWLLDLMALQGLKSDQIKEAALASVVPQALYELKMLTRRYFHTELIVIGDPAVKTGIKSRIDPGSDIGADRLANALAAWQKYSKPLIVVDFGTATTFDVVSGEGEYLGGVIAPGINLSLDALQKAAAKLPNVGIVRPERVIATGTVAAMQSGIYFGYVGLIEGIVSRIREEYGSPMQVVATGGLAALYAKACPVLAHIEPDLTLHGIRAVVEMNRKK